MNSLSSKILGNKMLSATHSPQNIDNNLNNMNKLKFFVNNKIDN